jgi:hypothetical protein
MKQYVVDLETSKKLDLPVGFKRIKEWVWFKGTGWELCDTGRYRTGHHQNPAKYPALILEEVLGGLPAIVESGKFKYRLVLYHDVYCYETLKRSQPDLVSFVVDNYTNPATAAAKLYIWLKENNHIGREG